MKKITIGRGRENDVRLKDESDKISRKQAVITFTPMGKMTIHDTSFNGTTLNGMPIPKPMGAPVRRGDMVEFAGISQLDWSQVKNPYRKFWAITWTFLILVVVIAGFLLWWFMKDEPAPAPAPAPAAQTETVAQPEPAAEPAPAAVTVQEPAPSPAPAKRKGGKASLKEVGRSIQKKTTQIPISTEARGVVDPANDNSANSDQINKIRNEKE